MKTWDASTSIALIASLLISWGLILFIGLVVGLFFGLFRGSIQRGLLGGLIGSVVVGRLFRFLLFLGFHFQWQAMAANGWSINQFILIQWLISIVASILGAVVGSILAFSFQSEGKAEENKPS